MALKSSGVTLKEDQLFKSGISFGSGMTYQLDKRVVNGVTYMDTPGLDDPDKRKQAAEAITKALRQEGSYQVVFVLTLEEGRIKPADAVTMQMVLRSAPIKHFGVIFNRLGKETYQKLKKEPEQQEVLLAKLTAEQVGLDTNKNDLPLPIPIYVERMAELNEKEGAIAEIKDLELLMSSLQPYKIDKNKVYELKIEMYEARLKEVKEQMEHFRKHTEELRQRMEEQRLMYEQQIQKLSRENERMRNFFPFLKLASPKTNDKNDKHIIDTTCTIL